MKKVLFAAIGLIVLFVAAVLIGPGLIDWNQYKDKIAAQAKAITGRDLTIDGDIQITVLPAPALVVKDVALANLEGATATEIVRLKSLEIRIALGPLLSGQIQVETIKLDTPVIELEVMGDGRRNWDFPAPAGKEKKDAGPPGAGGAAPKAGTGLDVRLDSFIIENGTLVYRDLKGGTVERVHGINARIAASSMTGPFEMSGRVQVRGVPLEYDLSVGQIIAGRTVPFSVNLGFEPAATKVQIAGALLGLGGSPKFKGKVKGEGKSVAELIQALAGPGPLPGFLGQGFELSGAVVATPKDLEIKDLAVSLGTSQAKGVLLAKLGDVPNVSLNLAVSRIDLDKWLSVPDSVAKPRVPDAPPKTSVTTGGQNKASINLQSSKKAPKAAKAESFQLPANFNGVLEVAVETITYRGGIIRRARLGAELANGEATISQLSAQLPGGGEAAFFGFVTAAEGKPRLEGEIETTVSDLRGLLGWLDVDIPDVPAHRLRKLTLSGKIIATPEQLEATDLDFQFDSSRLSGGVTVALSSRPSFGADLTLDRLNLDAYLPVSGSAAAKKTAPKKNGKKGVKSASPSSQLAVAKALGSFDANVKFRIKTLVFKEVSINDLVFDGTLFDDKLTVRRAGIAKLFGSSANIQGSVRNITKIPEFDNVAFQLRAADITRLFRLAGREPPLDFAKLGPVSVQGRVDGSLLKPALELTLRAAKSEVGLTGAIELLPVGLVGTVRVRNDDFPRLLGAVGVDYRPPGRFGGLNLKANFRGTPNSLSLSAIEGKAGPVTFSGDLKATLGGARPMIIADMKTSELVVDQFLPTKKTASIAPWRASPVRRADLLIPAAWMADPVQGGIFRYIAADPDRRWPVDPIDLAALRAFDAEVTLKAPAIVYGTYRLSGADVAATLGDGTLNATRINGTLFGGALKGNAVLGAGALNRIQAAIDIKGMDVGKASLAVTGKGLATGKMEVNVKLATAGRSVADMVSALSGSGSLALQRLDVKAGAKGTALAAALELVNALNGLGSMFGTKKQNAALADISGSFRMDRGIAKSNDLRLTSNLGTGLAGGSVDLPRWLIDVSGEVRLAEGALSNIIALAAKTQQAPRILPFRIRGRLDAPTVKLDTSKLGPIPIPGVGKLLEKAPQGVGAILQQVLPGLLGGQPQPQPQPQQPQQTGTEPPPPPPPPPPTEKKFTPQDLLKGF